jgi:single-stranded DNA-binding protein
MMATIDTNSCVIGGRLTSDPKLKVVNIGGEEKASCEFTMAVHGYGDRVEFLRFKAWDATARNIVEYCKKGRKMHCTCRARREEWEQENEEGITQKHDRTLFSVSQADFGEKPREEGADDFPV